MEEFLEKADKAVVLWVKRLGIPSLRYFLAVMFIWLGVLKISGVSSATSLVANAVYWFDPSWFVPFLGFWELLIGLSFLYKPLIREGIFLLGLQMVWTILPLIILPDIVYGETFLSLTLEGQYLVKNAVIIAAAIVIGSHVRDKEISAR